MRTGRPRRELRDYRKAFEMVGGLESVVDRMVASGLTRVEIVEELARMSGLKRVHPDTIRNWRREWASASETVAA